MSRAVYRTSRGAYHALVDDQVADEAPLGQVVQRCEHSRATVSELHGANRQSCQPAQWMQGSCHTLHTSRTPVLAMLTGRGLGYVIGDHP